MRLLCSMINYITLPTVIKSATSPYVGPRTGGLLMVWMRIILENVSLD